jgi:gamma-glutamyltranspeptidase/glutathione hydrolase
MAAYEARLLPPLTLNMGEATVATAPLTAGGLTVLQILMALKELTWKRAGVEKASLYLVEAARLAWSDRLAWLGDSHYVQVPQTRLLSQAYAEECAQRIRRAVDSGKPLVHAATERSQGGTIHLCSADKLGNFASLTLTHGGSFGAQVTVEGLGLTLGHGMSRFDPKPDHPNAPGPGKRPLNNMVPTIISRAGQATLAVGGRGGRKIPNAMLAFLASHLFDEQNLEQAIQAPRMHTEGTLNLEVENAWPEADRRRLEDFGYHVKNAASATLSAIAKEDGKLSAAMR